MIPSRSRTSTATLLLAALYFICATFTCATSTVAAQSITGAGATFPNPIYSRWFTEYHALHPNVKINYQPVGSGAGIRQVSDRVIDFGASDSPMTDEQIAQSKVKLIHIPTVLGAVVPMYNVPGVRSELHFAPDVIADIYLGVAKRWNDPRLVKDNPGANLPDQPILPVYRSDGSGTTYIFTDYLAKVSPEFRSRIGRSTSVRWPVGVGQKGNEGVSGIVRSIPYSIGYVELSYALQSHSPYGSIRNSAGTWVKASMSSMSEAADDDASTLPSDFRASITNASGHGAYPITSFTWLLVPAPFSDPAKGRAFADFLRWMLDHGEQEAAAMGYARLPDSVERRLAQTIDAMH